MKTNDVIGLGNALMDFLVEVDEQKLAEFGLQKGEMHLVEEEHAKEIFSQVKQMEMKTALGGSAANTLRGIGFLGGKCILCSKVGDDEQGESFVHGMQKHKVSTNINKHSSITGHCISFITPDSERTMSTCLGAAVHLTKEDLSEEEIKNSKVLYLEAYQFEGLTKEILLHAMNVAKENQTLIALDLADPALIKRNYDFFREVIKNYADILFLNETEAKEYTGLEPEEAVQELGKLVKIAVVKLGKEGSLICSEGMVSYINSYPAQAVDTTGAGDTYAAGFLYGYCRGWELEKAGRLGSLLAAKIVERVGVRMDGLDVEELMNSLV